MVEWNIGDQVELASGGPEMTVQVVDGVNVSCTWFEGKKQRTGTFHAGTLRKVEPNERRPKMFSVI